MPRQQLENRRQPVPALCSNADYLRQERCSVLCSLEYSVSQATSSNGSLFWGSAWVMRSRGTSWEPKSGNQRAPGHLKCAQVLSSSRNGVLYKRTSRGEKGSESSCWCLAGMGNSGNLLHILWSRAHSSGRAVVTESIKASVVFENPGHAPTEGIGTGRAEMLDDYFSPYYNIIA